MSKTQFRPKVEIEPYNSKLTISQINTNHPTNCMQPLNKYLF